MGSRREQEDEEEEERRMRRKVTKSMGEGIFFSRLSLRWLSRSLPLVSTCFLRPPGSTCTMCISLYFLRTVFLREISRKIELRSLRKEMKEDLCKVVCVCVRACVRE